MTTITSTISVQKSEKRTVRSLMNLRTAHESVDEVTQTDFSIDPGTSKVVECKKFAYLHIRDTMEVVISLTDPTVGSGSITLSDAQGIMAFPFPCTITLIPPSTSTLRHTVTATYS